MPQNSPNLCMAVGEIPVISELRWAVMWHWDQGRLNYFQFDELRKIAKFAIDNDLRLTDRATLEAVTGLPFSPDSEDYKPWRNYGRIFQLAMIATPDTGDGSRITEIGELLADDGKITTDDYFHFIAQATTDPSPALASWNHTADFRFPLLFVLRFLLARATQSEFTTKIAQIIGAYEASGFRGDEDQTAFLGIVDHHGQLPVAYRQAAESIKVLAQISYLSATKNEITVSLAIEDAADMFDDLAPVGGTRLSRGADEISRISVLFLSAAGELEFDYPSTILSDTEQAGFLEGGRVKRTHIIIERNGKIRSTFFDANPSSECDFCGMDTGLTYPWAQKVLDIHHLLPLCSGTRTSRDGTLLEDLVANCPTCHRAVHRYYDRWLHKRDQQDFADASEAKHVYKSAKDKHRRAVRV